MNNCKMCQMLREGSLARNLPNLVLEHERAVVAVNRRPAAPGHITIILKSHLDRTGAMQDDVWHGVGSLLGQLASLLEKRFQPSRVILLCDGKRSAHVHLHLIPEPAGRELSLPDVIADLNAATRTATLSDSEIAALVGEVRSDLGSPALASNAVPTLT